MAVIKHDLKACKCKDSALQALTSAAMLLPGLTTSIANAGEGDQFNFHYGHYQESGRSYGGVDFNLDVNTFTSTSRLVDVPNKLKPIEVDTVQAGARISLTDQISLSFNYSQDTWAGATPIATGFATVGHNSLYRDESGSVLAGASPILTSKGRSVGGTTFFDAQGVPILVTDENFITNTKKILKSKALEHVMVSASPETRKQMDMTLSYDLDDIKLDLGGGISLEKDYDSYFINLGGSWDLNKKLTTLTWSGSYTHSTIEALHDPDAHVTFAGYIRKGQVKRYETRLNPNVEILEGERDDWTISLGLSQILTKNTVFKTSLVYTHSSGFMENPYKATLAYNVDSGQTPDFTTGGFGVSFFAPIEQRPDLRRQLDWNVGVVQYIDWLDAALHFDYQLHIDDWGINAHTFEAEWVQPVGFGWTITPRVRYYSQSQANFYHPLIVTHGQLTPGLTKDEAYLEQLALMPEYFSSDHRLSGFGSLSGGVTVSKEFAKGVSLEAGYEYYIHRGSLKLGGGGEPEYADYDYYAFNAGLTVSLSALDRGVNVSMEHTQGAHRNNLPSGLMFAHMIDAQHQWMFDYRYRNSRRLGAVLQRTHAVNDRQIQNQACIGVITEGCFVKPVEMEMTTHMFSIMYAPTDWLNLMIMPQFVTKTMDMRMLDSVSRFPGGNKVSAIQHAFHQHESFSLGDVGMFAFLRLFDSSSHHLHISFGATAPTGKADFALRRVHGTDIGYTHYGMQTGSGTWDLKPGITYSGNLDDWFWGAQVTGTYRLGKNDVGFAFGNSLQASVWGGYQVFNWLSATVRGIYSIEGKIKGEYPEGSHIPIGPMDNTANYGGQYWDLGMGLKVSVPNGDLAGMSLGVEWLQPLVDDVNGFQLERDGTVAIHWSYGF